MDAGKIVSLQVGVLHKEHILCNLESHQPFVFGTFGTFGTKKKHAPVLTRILARELDEANIAIDIGFSRQQAKTL